jgi:hypothetical protein
MRVCTSNARILAEWDIVMPASPLKSGDGKQLIRRLVQTPTGRCHDREMPNQLSGQFVYAGAPKFVELFTPKAENIRSVDGRDVDALAVEDFSVHGFRAKAFFRGCAN